MSEADQYKRAVEQALRVLAHRYDQRTYVYAEVDELARAIIAMAKRLGEINLAYTTDTRSIESMLVDALEEELENYQFATKSWAAVTAVINALRARDTEIEELQKVAGEIVNIRAEREMLLANIKRLCPRELAAQIVQD